MLFHFMLHYSCCEYFGQIWGSEWKSSPKHPSTPTKVTKRIKKKKWMACDWIDNSLLYHIKCLVGPKSRADGVSQRQMAFSLLLVILRVLSAYKILLPISHAWFWESDLNTCASICIAEANFRELHCVELRIPAFHGLLDSLFDEEKTCFSKHSVITSCNWSRKIISQKLAGLNKTNCRLSNISAWVWNAF